MSENNLTRLSPGDQKPSFYTVNAAKRLTGIAPQTIKKYLPPDAWLVSIKGDKLFPAWLASTLEAWAAGRRDLQGAPEAHDAP
jgi:hypothetical protein